MSSPLPFRGGGGPCSASEISRVGAGICRGGGGGFRWQNFVWLVKLSRVVAVVSLVACVGGALASSSSSGNDGASPNTSTEEELPASVLGTVDLTRSFRTRAEVPFVLLFPFTGRLDAGTVPQLWSDARLRCRNCTIRHKPEATNALRLTLRHRRAGRRMFR